MANSPDAFVGRWCSTAPNSLRTRLLISKLDNRGFKPVLLMVCRSQTGNFASQSESAPKMFLTQVATPGDRADFQRRNALPRPQDNTCWSKCERSVRLHEGMGSPHAPCHNHPETQDHVHDQWHSRFRPCLGRRCVCHRLSLLKLLSLILRKFGFLL